MRILAAFLMVFSVLSINVITAHAASLEGKWRGTGFVKPNNGKREKIRCRISYNKETDKVYSVTGVCASAAGKATQSGSLLKVRKNRFKGDFRNAAHDVSGRMEVNLRGKRQTVTLRSSRGYAKIRLRKR